MSRNTEGRLQRNLTVVTWGHRVALAAFVVTRCAATLLLSLGGLFLLDILFRLTPLQLGMSIACAAVIVFWALYRFVLPLCRRAAHPAAVALVVEGLHSLDNNLSAGLQFSDLDRSQPGSPQLRAAVIDRASDDSTKLRFLDGVHCRSLVTHLALAGVGCLIALGATLTFDHPHIFFQRLMFANVTYPTSTVIRRVVVGDQSIEGEVAEGTEARLPADEVVECWLLGSGVAPESGRLVLAGTAQRVRYAAPLQRVTLDRRLRRLDAARDALQLDIVQSEGELAGFSHRRICNLLAPDAPQAVESVMGAPLSHARIQRALNEVARAREVLRSRSVRPLYHGQVERLPGPVELRFQLGDDQAGPVRVALLERPKVDVALRITPPSYTGTPAHRSAVGATAVTVLEGSSIGVALRSHNKRLVAAKLSIPDVPAEFQLEQAADGLHWETGQIAELTRIQHDVEFSLQVADEDGLTLKQPVRGSIQLEQDAAPVASLSCPHSLILSTAVPVLRYEVTDDFGIGGVRLVVRSRGGDILRIDSIVGETDSPATQRKSLSGQYRFDVATLNLPEGADFEVALVARDDRGEFPGREFHTEPIGFQVATESEVVAAIADLDRETERRLTEVIQTQLRVRSAR